MQNAECRVQNAEQNGNGESRRLRNRCSFCTLHSAFCTRAFTLIEMLVVIGIIGMLAGMLTVVIVRARHLSIRVECQDNERHIGETINLLALNNAGLYPFLNDAYPQPDPTNLSPDSNNFAPIPYNSGFPWWARVFEQWEGDLGLLYIKNCYSLTGGLYVSDSKGPYVSYDITGTYDVLLNPKSHRLTTELAQTDPGYHELPQTMRAFHCRMAGALDPSSAAGLFNSISYGINFDVKSPSPNGVPYTSASTRDNQPDQYRIAEVKMPSQFILVSEANMQDPDPTKWTGGRISPNNAPIVGRHSGYANVLFADGHVEAVEVAPGQGPSRDINMNTPLWTLPGQ
jgi:prepilin-type processing-associated H-X9-DG protein/prepilin-type N-terminal cleavage/methylation domain-containing protein